MGTRPEGRIHGGTYIPTYRYTYRTMRSKVETVKIMFLIFSSNRMHLAWPHPVVIEFVSYLTCSSGKNNQASPQIKEKVFNVARTRLFIRLQNKQKLIFK